MLNSVPFSASAGSATQNAGRQTMPRRVRLVCVECRCRIRAIRSVPLRSPGPTERVRCPRGALEQIFDRRQPCADVVYVDAVPGSELRRSDVI